MLPTNVMSFVKKIVSSTPVSTQSAEDDIKDKTSSLSKTSVISPTKDGSPAKERTATSPVPENADVSHLTAEEISILEKVFQKQQQFEKEEAVRKKSESMIKPLSRSNSCRICLRSLSTNDIFHTCYECQQKVCEDCSSYSKDVSKDNDSWMCSICRRKLADQQKTYDPDVLSRIVRRGTISSMSGKDVLLASNKCPGVSDVINTTPKLRPSTLDPLSGMHSRTGRDNKEKVTSPMNYGPRSARGIDLQRCSKDAHYFENSNSAPQTPSGRFGGQFLHDGKAERQTGRKHSSGTRHYNSESEDSQRDPRFISNESDGWFDANQIESRHNHQHGVVRAHSDSCDSTTGKYRLSRESSKERHFWQRQSTSSSNSSLEDGQPEISKEQNYLRRKKSKVKRRTRMQRQKSYHDDFEITKGGHLDPCSRQSGDDIDDGNKGNYYYNYDSQHQNHYQDQLNVPGHSKIYRHHSWDNSIASRRYSSESSDVSEAGHEYSELVEKIQGDENWENVDMGTSSPGGHPTQLSFLKPRLSKKLDRKKPVQSEDDYDAEQSANMESSPSPDNTERHHSPHMERRTSSEDSDVFKGNWSQRSSITSLKSQNWPAKIPVVEVYEAEHFHADQIPERGVSSMSTNERGGGRVLPKIPNQSVRLVPSLPVAATKTRQSKSVDLTPLTSTNERNIENLIRRSTLADFESVKIVIDDVDSDNVKDKCKKVLQRKVTLSRMSTDPILRTRGFGMRVVGGKIGEDGRLFAYVVWTVPEGPAELSGIVKGDKVLEWDGVSLVDKTFEEVCAIMDHSGDEVVLVTEHVIEGARHGSFDNSHSHEHILRRCSEGTGLDMLAAEAHINDLQVTRRRLPKPPEMNPDNATGEIQLVIWYDPEQPVLTITIVEAQDLPLRSDNSIPETYAKIRLLPEKNNSSFKTPVAEASTNPSWNESFNYAGMTTEDVLEKFLVVSVWDILSSTEKRSLGEVVLQLRKCEMHGRAEWYPLRDRGSLQLAVNSSQNLSTKSLLLPSTGDILHDLQFKRKEFLVRSMSDDADEQLALELIGHMVKSTSVDSKLLHPEQAWNRDRRRSSSGSEKSDASTHSCPHSLPSRRNTSNGSDTYYDHHTLQAHHRSNSFRLPKKEVVKSHEANYGSIKSIPKNSKRLSRSTSLKADKRLINKVEKDYLSPPRYNRWSSNSSLETSDDENNSHHHTKLPDDELLKHLGPGQISPNNFTGILGSVQREIKLGLIITKGFLEIDVICAKGVGSTTTGNMPDTYVKTYLKEGEKHLQKKKTRVIRNCADPEYRQTLKYSASEIVGRIILVMVWARQKGFDHNHGIGVAEINPSEFELNKLIIGSYRLFPMAKIESESNESN